MKNAFFPPIFGFSTPDLNKKYWSYQLHLYMKMILHMFSSYQTLGKAVKYTF